MQQSVLFLFSIANTSATVTCENGPSAGPTVGEKKTLPLFIVADEIVVKQ